MVGRDAELVALTGLVAKGRGAVVVGPAGIGKSRLASEVAAGSDRRVWWMAVTRDAASIPLGPFAPLVGEIGETVSALGAIERVLTESEQPALLVVDDAQYLDPASAAAVHGLARNASIPVLATVRTGERVPDAVTALWKDVELPRMELPPLDRADADELCASLLGGRADVRTLNRFWKLSRGHPLELRELVLAAREAGSLTETDGLWTFSGSFNPTSRLVELVEDRMARLGPGEWAVAEVIAYGEPLRLELLLSVVDHDVVERLERSDVCRVFDSGRGSKVVSLSHPLYGEVVRANLPATRRASIAGSLAEAASAVRVDPLRLTGWRLEAGVAEHDELVAAMRAAVGRMAWDLTLRFGQAALALQESYAALTHVGAALAELGEVEAAEVNFRRAHAIAGDPMLEAWAHISLADVWFYHANRMEDSLELVGKELAAATDPEMIDELTSALAISLMMYGDLGEVSGLAGRVLGSAEPTARARMMALVATAASEVQALRPDAVRSAVTAAMPLVEETRVQFANAEYVLHSVVCMADIVAGRVASARRRADWRRSAALESERGDRLAFWTMVNGQILLYEGLAQDAYDAQMEALLLLERTDSWLSAPLAQVEAAHAAAVLGQPDTARRHLAGVDAAMARAPRVRSRMHHVEALITAATDGLTAGSRAAVAAGDRAADDHHLLWAVEAWHLAVRMGQPGLAVGRLGEVAATRPGTVAELYRDHAAALLVEDAEALADVTRAFAGAGLALLAAETASHLSGIHRGRGDVTLARRASARARALLPEGSGARTPPLAELVEAIPLTPREREVALLAAGGATSRNIAERLFLSVRSVDNHLYRAYGKLGVKGRSQLAEVFALEDE